MSYRKILDVDDILDAVLASDSEFDELSSDEEDGDLLVSEYVSNDAAPDNEEKDNNTHHSSSSDNESSDDEPLSSIASKHSKSGEKVAKRLKKINCRFDERRPFIPPSDIEFVDADLEPTPIYDVSPFSYFKKFVSDDMFAYLAEESNKYAHQKSGMNLQATAKELEKFTGMFFHMGLAQMPSVKNFWNIDTHYPPVADVMASNRFQKMTSYLHMSDNLFATDVEKQDSVWKISPWLNDLNANFANVSADENQCVDEIMVAFKGSSLMKQYLPSKPKKWGFKLWASCSSKGFLHTFDIYQGKGTGTAMETTDDIPECGLGGNTVLKLCSALPAGSNFKIFADNYFSNFSMMDELKRRDLFYVGTISGNRVHGAPLKTEKQLKKEGSGAFHAVVETTSNISIVRWLDNKCVTVVSSYLGPEPLDLVRSYDSAAKKHISVASPSMIGFYNKYMGGVDLMDMMCALYKYQLRSKSWYLYMFYHTLTIALVNAWFLYSSDCEFMSESKTMSFSDFQAHVATALCHSGKRMSGSPSLEAGASKKSIRSISSPVSDVSFDSIDHLPVYHEKSQSCSNCSDGFAYVSCAKCKVHLCLNKNSNCFLEYHGK